ncbi:MAG: FAD-binding protein, partial [Devosiaceae bacterium]|nr:FAD-binding protein [Devosiaceae bacterium]
MTYPDLREEFSNWIKNVRGKLVHNQNLGEITWFRTGGAAQLFFLPADEDDLKLFLKNLPQEINVTIIGLGSNLLVRDGGLEGVVIRLPVKGFAGLEILPDHKVKVGAAMPDIRFAQAMAKEGIDGFTFYRGIRGVIGGALY